MKTDLIALKKKSSQANTTPRSETQVLLELEETQAEIVGPAEIFLRLWLWLCCAGFGVAVGPAEIFLRLMVVEVVVVLASNGVVLLVR